MHEPGDEVDRPVGAQPRGRFVEAGELAALDALEERGPAVDLALVEAVGAAEVLRALRLPVDVRRAARCPRPAGRRGPRGPRGRCRTARATSCRPSGPSATSRRRSPSGRRCGRAPTGPRTPRWPAVCGTSVPSSASMIRHSRRMPSSRVAGAVGGGMRITPCSVAAADLVDLVLASRRRRTRCSSGSPFPGSPCVVHPCREPLEVDHRFPTSCSRCSANFACGRLHLLRDPLGGPDVVARLVVAEHLAGDGDLVDLGRPVGEAHHRGAVDHRRRTASRCVTPSAPCTCIARHAMSCSTVGITTLAVAMSLRTRL